MHRHRNYRVDGSWEAGAVVLAAGSGERLGRGPKALVEVAGVPLVLHSLRALSANEHVAAAVVVAPSQHVGLFQDLIHAAHVPVPVTVVAGGTTRQDSAYAGTAALPDQVRWVAVTDAARPFVPPGTVDSLVAKVRAAAADPHHSVQPCGAFPALRIVDSMHLVGAHATVIGRIDRDAVRAAQTPQLVHRDCLLDAYAAARVRELNATDEVGLVNELGGTILAVPGDPWNIKITFNRDLALAEAIHAAAGAFQPADQAAPA